MDERQLGEAMLIFEREQAAKNLRPPLPCDGKLITQQYKRWNRTDEIYWLIKHNHGATTRELFELVNFLPMPTLPHPCATWWTAESCVWARRAEQGHTPRQGKRNAE